MNARAWTLAAALVVVVGIGSALADTVNGGGASTTLAVAKAGDTMTGQIRDTVQVLDGGSPDAGQAVTLSFSESTAGVKIVRIHRALTISASNIASGRSARLKVINLEPDAGFAITPPTGVKWSGATPSTIAAGKTAVLSCDYCDAPDAGACVCAWGAPQ